MLLLALLWLLHLILAAALRPPNATVNSTWSTQDGILLLQTASYTPGIACGFARLRSCKRCVGDKVFFFSVYTLGYDSAAAGESGTGADARSAQIIWSANRNMPVSRNSTLQLGLDGNLVLRHADGAVAWESNTAGLGVVGIELQPSANLVLFDSNKRVVWESFSSPTDTLVMGQPLKVGSRLVSTISNSDMSDGHFYLEVEHDKVSLKASPGQEYANWCAYAGVSFIQLDNGTLNCYNSTTVMSSIPGAEVNSESQFLRILPDGNFKFFLSPGNPADDDRNAYGLMDSFLRMSSPCGSYPGACGLYGICTPSQQCSCIQPHLSLIDQEDPAQGCLLDSPPVCSNQSHANEFIELQGMDYGPAQYLASTTSSGGSLQLPIDKCKSACLNNCSCKALVFYPDKSQCFQFTELYTLWNATLSYGSNPVTFIKTASPHSNPIPNPPVSIQNPVNAHRRNSSPASITIVTVIPIGILLLLAMIAFHRRQVLMKHCTQDHSEIFVPSIPNLPKLFKHRELCLITNNFQKKLGKGGFGTVFEGILSDGTKVAVKRLESARQGLKQFEAEVMTIGSIHHKNLVKLLGFGVGKSQYYLIYEFVPNLSLEKWLFKEGDHALELDWEKRFNIAMDIAKGLNYLHEGCQERVLHLDIKPQNILLDSSFRAKICDFGLAKFIDKGKSYIDTAMRGTPGYMAPEWLSSRVTEKTDVYSFGIVLLEIVSGQKTVSIPTGLSSGSMVRAKAFEQEGTLVEHVDMRLLQGDDMGKLDMEQVKKITRVGLLCIQEDPSQRPSMGGAVKMLEGSLQIPPISNTSLLQLNGCSNAVHLTL